MEKINQDGRSKIWIITKNHSKCMKNIKGKWQ